MSTTSLLIGIIPLIIFVIIDTFSGLKAALIAASIFAIIEAAASLYLFGEIDSVTIISVGLVLVLSAVSYIKQSSTFFKFQPVILSTFLGGALIVSSAISQPLLLTLALKYKAQFPPDMQLVLESPLLQKAFEIGTLYVGIALLFHALLTGWAAIKLNKWWWVTLRVVGFYVLTFAATLLAAFSARSQMGN